MSENTNPWGVVVTASEALIRATADAYDVPRHDLDTGLTFGQRVVDAGAAPAFGAALDRLYEVRRDVVTGVRQLSDDEARDYASACETLATAAGQAADVMSTTSSTHS